MSVSLHFLMPERSHRNAALARLGTSARGLDQGATVARSDDPSARGGAVLQFDPLDEYPIHQLPISMRYTGTSDRNFYDRCIFQGVDHEADAYFITGLG